MCCLITIAGCVISGLERQIWVMICWGGFLSKYVAVRLLILHSQPKKYESGLINTILDTLWFKENIGLR